MFLAENGIYIKNDNWETPLEYWKIIKPYIPKNLTINDPFYMNGNSAKWWKILGKDIIHENKDFFLIEKNTNAECYVSNLPYSKTNRVFKHLFYLDKPFIMLIPLDKLGHIKLQKILKGRALQLIISPIYKGFINENGEKTRCPGNYLGYLCYKINLEKDILFI